MKLGWSHTVLNIKDKKKIGINPQINQDGWKFLKKLREQGKKFANAAIVLGTDPITFSLSGSKVAKHTQANQSKRKYVSYSQVQKTS